MDDACMFCVGSVWLQSNIGAVTVVCDSFGRHWARSKWGNRDTVPMKRHYSTCTLIKRLSLLEASAKNLKFHG